MTLGHEIAGRVVELGAGVSDTQLIGTPVVLKGTGQGGPSPGLNADGGLAEQVLAPASYVLPIPSGISMAQAAVATDSVATAYHAVKGIAGLRLGEHRHHRAGRARAERRDHGGDRRRPRLRL